MFKKFNIESICAQTFLYKVKTIDFCLSNNCLLKKNPKDVARSLVK